MQGLDFLFQSVLNEGDPTAVVSIICTASALILGLIIALLYMVKSTYSKSFITSLILLPALVQIVIWLVNGSLGTGVAILGAFSLVRFRSVPASSREICAVFFSMAVGLATGMGYIGYAVVFTIIIGVVMLMLNCFNLGEPSEKNKVLKITIPEDIDYSQIFDDLFEKYTQKVSLESVKTTNLGSLYQLSYNVTLKDAKEEKAFIDDLRCRNGNLPICCARTSTTQSSL